MLKTFEDLSAKSSDFKRFYEHCKGFVNNSNQWIKVADFRLDAFRYNAPAVKLDDLKPEVH